MAIGIYAPVERRRDQLKRMALCLNLDDALRNSLTLAPRTVVLQGTFNGLTETVNLSADGTAVTALYFAIFAFHDCAAHGSYHCAKRNRWMRLFNPLPRVGPFVSHFTNHRWLKAVPEERKKLVCGPRDIIQQARIPKEMFQSFLDARTVVAVNGILAHTVTV